MTNFEACGVLLELRKKLERELGSLQEIGRENEDGARYRKQVAVELRDQIEALNKAGGALTKRG
jgi:hypothetical protein